MNEIYVVKYSKGSYDDYYEVTVFATTKKSTATKYVTKFNSILKRWKKYYGQYEELRYGTVSWIKDEHIKKHFKRWSKLNRFNKCYWESVKIR